MALPRSKKGMIIVFQIFFTTAHSSVHPYQKILSMMTCVPAQVILLTHHVLK